MFIQKKKNIKFNKIIKLQFQLGFSKLTPKLNLTLAPLGLNVTTLINEFNNYKYTLADENYVLNCNLQINTKNNIYNLKLTRINYAFLRQLITTETSFTKKILFLSWIHYIQSNNNFKLKNLKLETYIKQSSYINNFYLYIIDNNTYIVFYNNNKILNTFSQLYQK